MPVNLNTFRKSLFHSVTAAPSQIHADLNQLRQFDRKVEGRAARLKTLLPLAVLGGVILTFASAIVFNLFLSRPALLRALPSDLPLLLLVGFAFAAVVCWSLPFVWKQADSEYLTKLGGQFLIAALISGTITLVLQFPWLLLLVFNPAFFIFAVIGGIIALVVMQLRSSSLDLPNYRYELADRLVALLSRDMDITSRATLKILFKKQVAHPVKTIPYPRRADWKIDICDNEWLKIKAPLLNGLWVQLSLTERYRKRYGRNINGKLREKYQQRGLEIKLGIRLPKQGYPDLSQVSADLPQMVRLPTAATLKQLTLSSDLLKIKVLIPNWLGGARTVSMTWPQDPSEDSIQQVYQVILMMLLSAFQILNFACVSNQPKSA